MIQTVPDPVLPPPTKGIVIRRGAPVYEFLNNFLLFFQAGKINGDAADALELKPGDMVLDIGCASGVTAFAVEKKLPPGEGLVVGIDASPEMIHQARKITGKRRCRFDIVAAENLPYTDASFDKVVSTLFFHHLNLEDKYKALAEVRRVLKQGGVFVLVDVDTPTSMLGRFSARSGEWLFKQPEIGENIDGKLVGLMEEVFGSVSRIGHYLGYITAFKMKC